MSGCFWPDGEPRIHAMLVAASAPSEEGQPTELRLALNNRAEIHGEVLLRVPAKDLPGYTIGSVYAAYFKKTPFDGAFPGCFWPEGEPRIHAIITSISRPFNCGKQVELQLSIYNRPEIAGEIALRVPAGDASQYHVGAEYSAHFKLVSKAAWY